MCGDYNFRAKLSLSVLCGPKREGRRGWKREREI